MPFIQKQDDLLIYHIASGDACLPCKGSAWCICYILSFKGSGTRYASYLE